MVPPTYTTGIGKYGWRFDPCVGCIYSQVREVETRTACPRHKPDQRKATPFVLRAAETKQQMLAQKRRAVRWLSAAPRICQPRKGCKRCDASNNDSGGKDASPSLEDLYPVPMSNRSRCFCTIRTREPRPTLFHPLHQVYCSREVYLAGKETKRA